MQASARTCGRSSTDSVIQNVGSSQYILIILHKVIQLTTIITILDPREKAAPPANQQIGQFPPTPSEVSTGHPFLFLFLHHPQESSLCSDPVTVKIRRIGRIFPEHAERSFLDPEYSFVAVRLKPELGCRSKSSPAMFAEPFLDSTNTPNCSRSKCSPS